MRPRYFAWILLSLWGLCSVAAAGENAWHFTAKDVTALHSKPADYQLSYGKDPLQTIELRLPLKGTPPYPVAIIIHGGCWLSSLATIRNAEPLADALRNQGIATWNIEYRGLDVPGGGWPGTFLDVAHAVDYLRVVAKKYDLDLEHVVVVGHSAGGHLALWTAARKNIPAGSPLYTENPLKLKGVVSLGGVPNLKEFRKQGIKVCERDVIADLLGASKIDERYLQSSPNELLPLQVPQILLYGNDETAVPEKFGMSYLKKSQALGDSVNLLLIKDAAHHEYMAPNSIAWPDVLKATLSLLDTATPSH